MRVRVLDLDGVADQPPLAERLSSGRAIRVPARDLAPSLRLWARREAMAELAARLERAGEQGDGPTVTFLGSGDFHNLSPLLLRQAQGPLVVVHVDNHPDWVRAAPRFHCGAWVNRALEQPNVLKVITVGPTSADLDSPDLKGGAFGHLASGRIEMFAWRRRPSRILRRLRDGPGHRVEKGRVAWRCVGGEDWEQFLDELTTRIPPEAGVWLSIDKDALRREDAATNWDQGLMPLDALERLVTVLAGRRRIAGADICGDWSRPEYDSVLKAFEARFDQPATSPADLSVNARTNARLLHVFEQALAS
jgi:arginase family enzyme